MSWRDRYISDDLAVTEQPQSGRHTYDYGDDIKVSCVRSEETRAKISAAKKGQLRSVETRVKISLANKKPKSVEHRAKIKASWLKRAPNTWSSIKNAKPMMTPYGVFPSRRAVAIAANVYETTVSRWMKYHPEHYYYIKDSK